MKKVVRNGKVAVIISPSYGSGWASNGGSAKEMAKRCFCPEMAELLLSLPKNSRDPMHIAAVQDLCNKLFPGDFNSVSGRTLGVTRENAVELVVEWVRKGTKFRIHEYDGAECIVTEDDDVWVTA